MCRARVEPHRAVLELIQEGCPRVVWFCTFQNESDFLNTLQPTLSRVECKVCDCGGARESVFQPPTKKNK